MSEKELHKQLAYLAENFDFNDPEDAWAKKEYNQIKKLLGLDNFKKEKRKSH